MNKIEQIADYRISLHRNTYNTETINNIMSNIIEEFDRNNVEVLGSNPEDNVLGFSVNSIDENLIRECVRIGYDKFFCTLGFVMSDWMRLEDLYNLTILVNIDRSNVLLVL